MVEIRQRLTANSREYRFCEGCGKPSFQIDKIKGDITCKHCGMVKRGRLIDYYER